VKKVGGHRRQADEDDDDSSEELEVRAPVARKRVDRGRLKRHDRVRRASGLPLSIPSPYDEREHYELESARHVFVE
jgi:hypothetical protein